MSGLIVVFVNAWTGSPDALRWAADEARFRAARLHAVMVWETPRPPSAPAARPPVVTRLSADDPRVDADARLAAILDSTLGPHHGATYAAVHGPTVPVLVDATRYADLIVLDAPRLSDIHRTWTSLLTVMSKVRRPVVAIPSGRRDDAKHP